MTEVAFHVNAPDKLRYACRLLRKAYLKGTSLFVLVPPHQLETLDAALWTMSPDAFIPHCRATDPDHVKTRTPIHIGTVLAPRNQAAVLVNLQEEWVGEWRAFEKVIEVVAQDDLDRQVARERWQRYRKEGAEPVSHDLASPPPG